VGCNYHKLCSIATHFVLGVAFIYRQYYIRLSHFVLGVAFIYRQYYIRLSSIVLCGHSFARDDIR